MDVTKPYKFIRSGAMDVTKTYIFISLGAMDVTKPYNFRGLGAMDVSDKQDATALALGGAAEVHCQDGARLPRLGSRGDRVLIRF